MYQQSDEFIPENLDEIVEICSIPNPTFEELVDKSIEDMRKAGY